MTHITKSKFARGGGSHNIYLLTPTGRRAVDIRLVKIVYQCIHCLGKLKTHNAGVQCELNSNHYGYIHRDEAKQLTDEERFMKLSEMFPSEYLRGIDIGNPIVVTIKGVTAEQVRNRDNNRMEQEFIMRFEELEKKLRLNVTMAKECAKIINDPEMDTDNWTGKKVTIYRTTLRAFGQEHIVPRIRQPERGDVDLSKAIKSSQPAKPRPAANGSNNEADSPRPQFSPSRLREILQKKVENSTLRDKVTEEFLPIQYHPFGEKTAQIVASRFQAAFSIGEGLPEKPEAMYKTCLSWLTGHSSAKNISAAWADAILDWLVNGNKADKFKAAIVAPAMAEALAIYEQATQEAKANEMADSIMGDTPWDELPDNFTERVTEDVF